MLVENIRKLQDNTAALYTERKTLQLSAIRGSGRVWSGKLKRPPLPSGCEIFGCKMSAHRIPDMKCWRTEFRMWNVGGRNFSPSGLSYAAQGGPSTCVRCRDPSGSTPSEFPKRTCTAMLSGSTPSGFPKRTCAAMLSGTCEHHTPDDSISYPDMLSGSLTNVSKPCYVIRTACHNPYSAALRWCVRTPCLDILWIPKNSPQSRIALVIKNLLKHQNLTQFD